MSPRGGSTVKSEVKECLRLTLASGWDYVFYFCLFGRNRDEYQDLLSFNRSRLPTNTNYNESIATGAHVTNKLPYPRDHSTSSPVNSHSTQFGSLQIHLIMKPFPSINAFGALNLLYVVVKKEKKTPSQSDLYFQKSLYPTVTLPYRLRIIPLTKAVLHGDKTMCYKWVNTICFPTSFIQHSFFLWSVVDIFPLRKLS